jgi:hypothetical protein
MLSIPSEGTAMMYVPLFKILEKLSNLERMEM